LKRTVFVFFLSLLYLISSAAGTIRLREISNPEFDIHIHGPRLYIPEGNTTFIYSLTNYSLIGKFGKEGEGPGELKGEICIVYLKDKLIVESADRLTTFSPDGKFVGEQIHREKSFVRRLTPVGNQMAGFGGTVTDKGKNYIVLSFFDRKINKTRDFTRTLSNFQKDGSITFMMGTFNFKVFQDRIYVQYLGKEMKLNVFDNTGKFLFKIGDPEFNNRKVSAKDRREAMDYFRKFWPRLYSNRQRIRFSDFWGGVGTFFFDEAESMLYVITYARDKEGKYLFYKYDPDGKLKRKFYLDVGYRDIWAPFPLDIENGKLYQLLENPDDEEWDLVIRDL